MPSININTDAAVVFTEKLERMGRSDLPVVINQTLNNAAFDVKQNTMLRSSRNTFINRKKTFFKSTSTVKKSSGFNIDRMKAEVGFKDGNSNPAVADLQQQEHGGSLKRSFIANDEARVGSKPSGNIRKANRISVVKRNDFVDAEKSTGKSDKQKFIRSSIVAKQRGSKYVLDGRKTKKGRRILYRITKLQKDSNSFTMKTQRVLSVKSGERVSIKATGFMKKATRTSSLKMPQFFVKNAKKRLKI